MPGNAESGRVCIPVQVVADMIYLLEDDHVAWPIAGAQILRTLKAELAQFDGGEGT